MDFAFSNHKLVLFLISSWQLHFIQSEFKGQLPQPFASGPQATQIIPAHMNDQNLEEPTRYVSHSDMCACLFTQGSLFVLLAAFVYEISNLCRWIYGSATI